MTTDFVAERTWRRGERNEPAYGNFGVLVRFDDDAVFVACWVLTAGDPYVGGSFEIKGLSAEQKTFLTAAVVGVVPAGVVADWVEENTTAHHDRHGAVTRTAGLLRRWDAERQTPPTTKTRTTT